MSGFDNWTTQELLERLQSEDGFNHVVAELFSRLALENQMLRQCVLKLVPAYLVSPESNDYIWNQLGGYRKVDGV